MAEMSSGIWLRLASGMQHRQASTIQLRQASDLAEAGRWHAAEASSRSLSREQAAGGRQVAQVETGRLGGRHAANTGKSHMANRGKCHAAKTSRWHAAEGFIRWDCGKMWI